MHCLSANLPAKASADVELAIIRLCLLYPMDAGHGKRSRWPRHRLRLAWPFRPFVSRQKDREVLLKFFSFLAKQRKETKESSPLPINLSEKEFRSAKVGARPAIIWWDHCQETEVEMHCLSANLPAMNPGYSWNASFVSRTKSRCFPKKFTFYVTSLCEETAPKL